MELHANLIAQGAEGDTIIFLSKTPDHSIDCACLSITTKLPNGDSVKIFEGIVVLSDLLAVVKAITKFDAEVYGD
jgi:hypothetical protein